MAVIDGGRVLATTLKRFDVTTVFTLHGGHLDGFYRAAVDSGIRLVDTRHEQAAGLAASAYSRTNGQVGVAMGTAGGGVTNLVTAAANAYADCVSVVFFGGAPPLRDYDALPVNSGIDQLSVMHGITKWAHRVTHVERLADLVGRAFQIARGGRPGPVYLELPSDVLFALIDENSITYPDGSLPVYRPAPAPEAVERALNLLVEAERPVILAGGGVIYSDGGNELRRFAELSGIPVLTNNKSRGVLPTNHPLWAKGFGSLGGAAARGAGKPDVVLMLGARLGLYTGGRRTSVIPSNATVIQVDICPEEIGRLRDIQVGIVADCSMMLRAMIETGSDRNWPERKTWVDGLLGDKSPADRGNSPIREEDASHKITPQRMMAEVASALPQDAIVVTDGGETPAWLDAVAESLEPRRWLGHGYLGMMGEGIPLAIGAQIAHPNLRVICVSGDGSVGFNFSEFDTMIRHNLPIIVLINNDCQWGMSAHGQDLIFGTGKHFISDLAPTRYDLAAAGFGAHPELVESIEELRPALQRALHSGRPACINVMTDPSVIAPVTKRFLGRAAEGLVSPEGKARVPYADVLEV